MKTAPCEVRGAVLFQPLFPLTCQPRLLVPLPSELPAAVVILELSAAVWPEFANKSMPVELAVDVFTATVAAGAVLPTCAKPSNAQAPISVAVRKMRDSIFSITGFD